jgi:hypothetical protein
MEALLLSFWRLHPGRCCCVSPVGHLHNVPRNPVKVAGVIDAASPQLPPDWHTQQVGEQLSGFQLSPVSFGLLGIGHQVIVRVA